MQYEITNSKTSKIMNEIEKRLNDIRSELVSKCIELVYAIPHTEAIDISELEITYNESLVVSVDVAEEPTAALVEFGDGFLVSLAELHIDDVACIVRYLQSLTEKKRYSVPFTIVQRESLVDLDSVTLKGEAEVSARTKVLAVQKAKDYFLSHFEDGCWKLDSFNTKELS